MSAPIGAAEFSPGGHALPARVSSASAVRPPRRKRTGVIVGILSALAVALGVGALQVTANLGYDDTREAFEAAADRTERSVVELRESTDELVSTSDTATLLMNSDSGILADPAAKQELASSIDLAGDAATSADQLLREQLPQAASKPAMFWELFAASESLEGQVDQLDDFDAELTAEPSTLEAAAADVTEAGLSFVGTAATAAGAFEAAHLSAKNDDIIALRDAASSASRAAVLDDTAVSTFVALQDAAAQVIASEQAELAEKAGPLQGARVEIEAFARSLAPGVLLEFDWNPIVNGAGENGSMGGLTTWWWDEPDRAVIELSNSVAEQWPADRSKALVAHEVGHAISVKCEEMYDSSTQDSIEKWATAWAIGMGFTDDANGVWAYGYPPQSYIDASYGCR